ncbi:carboxylic ester hydrolase activity, partial [Pristimantis euphronides]
MALRLLILFLWPLFLGAFGSGEEDGHPQVEIQYGKLRGKMLSVKETNRTVHAFYGVPFAKPPVGSLRLAAPERPESWSSVREAQEYAPMCLQDIQLMEHLLENVKIKLKLPPVSEDCLYLNIFTPADRVKGEKLPVMVHIHGGGLVMGGAMMFDGSVLSAHENVAVVSTQYRLGILGFFSNGDKRASGNYGLLDQVAALRWVQENIEDFGGDPDSVTIFGVSAGGVSVSALVASPLAKGLFHKAIAESGVAVMPNLVARSTEEVILANISGCDEEAMVECLMAKSEEEIMSIGMSKKFFILPVSIDGVFFPQPVEQILANKEANSVPFIIGVNNNEFGWVLPLAMNITGFKEGMERETVQEILENLPILGSLSSFSSLLIDEYIGDETDPAEIRNRVLDLAGDVLFVIPALRAAKYHRDSSHPVYFYEFQHRPSSFKDTKPDFVKADHGDEVFFVIGGPFLKGEALFTGSFTEEEKTLSKTVMKYWANFARTGDPSGPGLVQWPQYGQNEDYMELNLEQKTGKRLKADKYEFWTKVLPHKMQEKEEAHSELEGINITCTDPKP